MKVVVIGYGSQGHDHAMNMRDSSVKEVKIALRPGLASAAKADAAMWDDNNTFLTPNERQRALYYDHLQPNMKEGAALAFAHGLKVHFGLIEPRADIYVFIIAPKGPGYTVRSEYERGAGVPLLLAVHANPTGNCHDIGLSYGMVQRSVVPGPALSRPPPARNAKRICSANGPCFAAASRV